MKAEAAAPPRQDSSAPRPPINMIARPVKIARVTLDERRSPVPVGLPRPLGREERRNHARDPAASESRGFIPQGRAHVADRSHKLPTSLGRRRPAAIASVGGSAGEVEGVVAVRVDVLVGANRHIARMPEIAAGLYQRPPFASRSDEAKISHSLTFVRRGYAYQVA
jgi:hypothetical protein